MRKSIRLSVGVGLLAIIVSVLLALHPWSSAPTQRAKIVSVSQSVSLIPKKVSGLSVPPSYAAADTPNHCAVWRAWLAKEGAAGAGEATVTVAAPDHSSVTILSVRSHVIRSFRPRHLTKIACARDGGSPDIVPPNGYLLFVGGRSQRTILVDAFGNYAPPHSLLRIPKGTTANVVLYAEAGVGRLIEWDAELSVLVGQRKETLHVGSPSSPLRTCGCHDGPFTHGYDYDLATRQWTRVAVAKSPPPQIAEAAGERVGG